jgi:hypothetical protein
VGEMGKKENYGGLILVFFLIVWALVYEETSKWLGGGILAILIALFATVVFGYVIVAISTGSSKNLDKPLDAISDLIGKFR